jgi:hypothetical protein
MSEIRTITLTVPSGENKPTKYLTRESLARKFKIDPRNKVLDHFHAAAKTEMGKTVCRLFLNDPSLTIDRLQAYDKLQKLHGLQRIAEYRRLNEKYGDGWDHSIRGRKD